MADWLSEAVARVGSDPLLQGLVAALATFVLEDPTTIGAGLLVADGKMAFRTALAGVFLGIAVGDVGLYAIGRLAGPRVLGWRLVSRERLERVGRWFDRHLIAAVLLSRFVPGMRLPTYVGAGISRASFGKFVVTVVGATLVWTWVLLTLTVEIGEAVLPLLGRARWPLALATLAALLLGSSLRRTFRRRKKVSGEDLTPVVSRFELWPAWVFYLPVGVYYLWAAVRYRGVLLPTLANPTIHTGGLIGESKSDILDRVRGSSRRFLAEYVVLERDHTGDAAADLDRARRKIEEAGLAYPLVAKPDIGQRGAGVRPVRDERELEDYLVAFPAGRRMLLQKLVGEPDGRPVADDPALPARARGAQEAGVLYWRHPDEATGRIFSVTLKWMPRVVGDGRRTVAELIAADPRARRLSRLYLDRLGADADRVPVAGEEVPLVFAGNHCQGAVFRDGTDLATPELLERIEEIAQSMDRFHFGRFDVRFRDVSAFFRGEDLAVVEINGAGAEATHIWDASAKLFDAYGTLFEQFRILFEIGAANRRRGFRPPGPVEFLREVRAYRRLSKGYPSTL